MTTNQIAVSGGADVEIRTLNVRMAPLTLAMLSQVQRADLIDVEADNWRGIALGRIVTPDGVEVLWRDGRDLRRCSLPTAVTTPLSEQERALGEQVARKRHQNDTAIRAVSGATRFSEMAAGISTENRYQTGGWRTPLTNILGAAEVAALEESAERGEIGPRELEGPKARVLEWLDTERARIEADAAALARLAAEREDADVRLAGLVADLAALDQVFLQ